MAYDVIVHPHKMKAKIWLGVAGAAAVVFVVTRSLLIGPQAEPSRLTFILSYVFAGVLILLFPIDARIYGLRIVKAVSFVGLFSYSLYLIHFLTIGLVNQTFHYLKIYDPHGGALLVVSVIVAIFIGWIFFMLFERPLLHRKRASDSLDFPANEAVVVLPATTEPADKSEAMPTH
jgi:peptidoglycan/LPS O-acetylase OafA/YrhL